MRLQQIRVLVAIAETGSIRAAARALGQSQPALTKGIRLLEEELSVPLVQRTPRGVVLTEYGRALFTRAKSVTAEVTRMREEIAQMRGVLEGSVSVAFAPIPAMLLMSRVIEKFRKRLPDVRVHVVDGLYPAVLNLVRDGAVELAIGPQPPAEMLSPEFRVEQLYVNPLIVACRIGHPRAAARSLKDLLDCEWALHGPLEGPGSLFAPAFLENGLQPPPTPIHCESFIGMLALLEHTDVLTVMPKRLILHLERQRHLQALALREKLPSWDISLLTRSSVPLTPAASAFATLVRRTPLAEAEAES